MTLDKAIAAVFLLVGLIYGYAAFTYRLLPFEQNMSFLPNTLPTVLSILVVFLALIILVSPKAKAEPGGDVLGDISLERLREYKTGQALTLIAAMVLYALALRPAGFLAATVLFIVAGGWILGERKLHVMIPVALVAAGSVWFLVQETLGIYLRPLPGFLS